MSDAVGLALTVLLADVVDEGVTAAVPEPETLGVGVSVEEGVAGGVPLLDRDTLVDVVLLGMTALNLVPDAGAVALLLRLVEGVLVLLEPSVRLAVELVDIEAEAVGVMLGVNAPVTLPER